MAATGNAAVAALALLLCAVGAGARRVEGANVTCSGSPPNPANGTFNCSEPSHLGSKCSATCDSGFVGRVASFCLPPGEWSPAIGACVPGLCNGSPPAIANGAFNCTATVPIVGRRCKATCDEGFGGRAITFCLPTGEWSPAFGACVLDSCSGSPPNPANGTFDCGATSRMGNKCKATCDAGFFGEAFSICLPTGEWSPVFGACV